MDTSHGAQTVFWLTAASFLTFSIALSTAPNFTYSRIAAICILATLQYNCAKILPSLSVYGDLPYALSTVMFTIFWHAVDYLIAMRVSSRDLALEGRKWTQFVSIPLGLLLNWRRLGTPWQISRIPAFSRRHPQADPRLVRLLFFNVCFQYFFLLPLSIFAVL